MNLPYENSESSIITATTKQVYIQPEQPERPNQGDIWIDTSKEPKVVYKYDGTNWIELRTLEQDLYIGNTEPENKYNGLLWIKVTDDYLSVESLQVYISENNSWLEINIGGSSSGGIDTYKVKASETDSNPGFLNEKVDNETIQVNNNKLSVKFQDDKQENVVWSSQRITKEAIIKAIIFG